MCIVRDFSMQYERCNYRIRVIGVLVWRVFFYIASSRYRAVLQQQLGAERAVRLRQNRGRVCSTAATFWTPNVCQNSFDCCQSARRVCASQTRRLEAQTIRAWKYDEKRVDWSVKPHPTRSTDAVVCRQRVRRRTTAAAVSRHRGGNATSARWTRSGRGSQQQLLVQDSLVIHHPDILQRVYVIFAVDVCAAAADILLTLPPPVMTDRRAAAADSMAASRWHYFRDVL